MPAAPACRAADFFVLRTPSLPADALAVQGPPEGEALRERLRELIQRGEVREALALASPVLASRIGPWLEGRLDASDAARMERSLLKYLSRMSRRATPFGLFAGVSTGRWGSASSLQVAPWPSCRKVVRLDWGALEGLADRLARDPEIGPRLRYRTNTSVHARGGWYRYLERRGGDEGGRTYHLEAAEASRHLDFVLQRAEEGIELDRLASALARHAEVDQKEAQAYLDRIVACQLLCGEVHPPLTAADPLGHMVQALRPNPAAALQVEALEALGREIRGVERAPLGAHPDGYAPRLPSLTRAGMSPDERGPLQVVLFRPSPGLALSPGVRSALEAGAETLRRLTPPPAEGPLDRFRTAFLERYERRWMPLLEVLDEESGIGFDGGVPLEGRLLEGLTFHRPGPGRPWTRRDAYLMAQVPRWQGSQVWALGDADLEALANPDPPAFPPSFAALAVLSAPSVEALDAGDFQFWMEHYSGPSAARWLGRFAAGDPDLEAGLRRHLAREEAARPEAVFAEVVHVPEGRTGNVLSRPRLRDHEIPFLAMSGVPGERTLLPADLRVTVRGDRVLLASARLRRPVVPRLSSAHNYNHGPAVYRFLAHLQDQDGRPGGWSWGALADQPFLPRVVRGRHVLCKARWRIRGEAWDAAGAGGAWQAFQRLRADLGLPRFVEWAELDQSLLVDLDQAPWVEALYRLVRRQPAFVLTEAFPAPGHALVAAPEGPLTHELVVPFETETPALRREDPVPPPAGPEVARAFHPGSEWLYLKLYGGPASADRLLVGLEPLLRVSKRQGLWDRWHFLRYRDPHPHLRLRFHGTPFRLLAELLPLLREHLEGPQVRDLLWKWQIDTFEPELERYGGPLGFSLAEAWFHEDSEQTLARLAAGLPREDRWREALRDTDQIWAQLGLDLRARKELAAATRARFRAEFGGDEAGVIEMGAKFRGLRRELEAKLLPAPGPQPAAGAGSLRKLREASEQRLLLVDRASLAASLAHMHVNRLLRSDHRESEWVLMEFLTRLYEGRLAQDPGGAPVQGAKTTVRG